MSLTTWYFTNKLNTLGDYLMRISEIIKEEMINGMEVMSLEKFVKVAPKLGAATDTDLEDIAESLINEAEFGLGAKLADMSQQEIEDYLARSKKYQKYDPKDKSVQKEKEALGASLKKDRFQYPFMHPSNIKIVDENDEIIDTDDLKRQLMERPKTILKQNAKIKHSSNGKASLFYNMGLPALIGLFVDENTGEFKVAVTCKSAGICKTYCYARGSNYVRYAAPSMDAARIFNFLMNDPEGFKAQFSSEISQKEKTANKKNQELVIRLHTSGDFLSNEYKELLYDVANDHPHVLFYAYTKESSVALDENKPKNFVVNFSQGAIPAEEKKVDLVNIKNSRVVPEDIFADLIKEPAHPDETVKFTDTDELKNRISKKYKMPVDSILTYEKNFLLVRNIMSLLVEIAEMRQQPIHEFLVHYF